MTSFLGLDPGKQGGIAVVSSDGAAYAHKMPETLVDMRDLFQSITHDGEECFALLEAVSSSPQMGVVSAFSFGQTYGHLEAALVFSGIPFERVRPLKWQTAMGCRTGGNKNITRQKAQELFPDIRCTHAISDSLLIALYNKRTYQKP